MNQLAKKTFEAPAGTISYIDTGQTGTQTIVFVHGNPASSAEFVPAIKQLMSAHRCIAVDHLGFGDSDKPADWDYLPRSHAANLAALLNGLDLTNVTMVVGDWGGPIGLSWAIDSIDRINHIIVTNTWLWPVNRSLYYQGFSKAMGGPIGRYLIRNRNLFAQRVVKSAWGSRTALTADLHALFTDVHTSKDQRNGMWVFPKEITGSTEWLDGLWARRASLHSTKMSLLWGMEDIAFRPDVLDDWIAEFPEANVERLDDVGHFVALEATDVLVGLITGDG